MATIFSEGNIKMFTTTEEFEKHMAENGGDVVGIQLEVVPDENGNVGINEIRIALLREFSKYMVAFRMTFEGTPQGAKLTEASRLFGMILMNVMLESLRGQETIH